MKGAIVEFKVNGSNSKGYLARPKKNTGKAVILLQEWWGLVDHIKEVADRLANEGFVVLAPDLYHGEVANSPTDAQKLAMALQIDQVEKDLRGAVDYLLNLEAVTSAKVGIVGFCMGGALSLYSACINKKIGACIVYYGIRKDVENKLSSLEAPVLGFFGELDKGVPVERVNQLDEEMKKAGKEHTFIVYPNANHAFFNDTRPAYDLKSAKDSWEKMIEFFNKRIK